MKLLQEYYSNFEKKCKAQAAPTGVGNWTGTCERDAQPYIVRSEAILFSAVPDFVQAHEIHAGRFRFCDEYAIMTVKRQAAL